MPRKKQPTREPRGSVHISKRGRMLYLRWAHEGQRYERGLGLPDSPVNRQAASAKAAEIEKDIAREEFDSTLEKYWPKVQDGPEHPSTVDLWERFTQARKDSGTGGQAISSRYKPMLANLKRFNQDVDTEADARAFVDLLNARQQPLTLNQNVSLLRGFGNWCIEQGYWKDNPFERIQRTKGGKMKNPKRQPFTAEEVQSFLATIRQDRYYSHYHDFCATLFYLGLRPSEAIGLKWKDIDFQHNVMMVVRSLSRGNDGRTAGYARSQKTTKNGEKRALLMPPPLQKILKDRSKPSKKPEDLVFLTPKGNPIDDHSFSQRCWRAICRSIGVDKVPYAARHTVGSHLHEDGASPAQVASALGNGVDTTIRYYLHSIEQPIMPTYEMEDDIEESDPD